MRSETLRGVPRSLLQPALLGMGMLLAVALAPRTASALAVTIQYSISGGFASGKLNGLVDPGGTIRRHTNPTRQPGSERFPNQSAFLFRHSQG